MAVPEHGCLWARALCLVSPLAMQSAIVSIHLSVYLFMNNTSTLSAIRCWLGQPEGKVITLAVEFPNLDINIFLLCRKSLLWLLTLPIFWGSKLTTGCCIILDPLCFLSFSQGLEHVQRNFNLYSIAMKICYMIGTRILKIDLEIVKIIEIKVGTCILDRVKK